jgi:hypothetical protein
MKASLFVARAVLTLTAIAPWLWLIVFGVFAAGATFHLGRLPSYNNPDPKNLAHLASLHEFTSLLLVPVALSPLAVSACLAIRSFVSPDIRDERWKLLAYGVGYGLVAALMFGDVLGLGSWFLD